MRIHTYLDLEAALDGEYLHPGGREATHHLLDKLRGTSVLEVGCGTGATLARLDNTFPFCFGVDRSPRMLRRARRKSSASLVRADAKHLPFRDSAFDGVVAESVAALVEFEKALPEWVRVLKPGGTLALNDGLWREGLPPARVTELTEWCLESFGQRMAPGRPETIATWTDLLRKAGLTVHSVRINSTSSPPARAVWARRWQKLRRPWLWPALYRYRKCLGKIDRSLLEFWIITASKPETGAREFTRPGREVSAVPGKIVVSGSEIDL